jgi:hypothetical protein
MAMSFPQRVELLPVLLLLILFGAGCGSESEQVMREKLRVIAQDDMDSVIAELPEDSVADSAYYHILSFKTFDEGRYSALAVVEFHFLEPEIAVMVRKYRYYKQLGQWERYFNEYRYTHNDTTP